MRLAGSNVRLSRPLCSSSSRVTYPRPSSFTEAVNGVAGRRPERVYSSPMEL